jgi:hypothetical protein
MYKFTKDSLAFFNNFKFKKLKNMDTSDGVAYSCDLFFDNQKIASVENRGDGGPTDIHYIDGGEEFFSSLNVKRFLDMSDITFDIDNEFLISELIETKLHLKEILKLQSKSILFSDKNGKIMQVVYRYTFNKIKGAGQINLVKKRIDGIIKDGGVILNTNLTRLGII